MTQNEMIEQFKKQLEEVVTKIKELDYRGTRQTVWRVNADLYFHQLAQVKSWT